MSSPPFDLNRFRRIFDPYQQSAQRGAQWEPDPMHPPLPPYPLNPSPIAPPPMLQAPPEPVPGPPQKTPQTPLNPGRMGPPNPMSPMTSSPRNIPQPPYPQPQKPPSLLDFPPGGPATGQQQPFNLGTDIRQTMPPRPQMPTGAGLPNRMPEPEPPPPQSQGPFSTDYPRIFGGEDTGRGLRRPDELKPGTITNENMDQVPPFPDWYQRPGLDMHKYEGLTDIADQAQANSPDQWLESAPYGPKMPQSEEEEINEAMSKYRPQTGMQDRLNSLLDSFPERDQDMSKWRKFGSFLVGAGLGPEAQEKATYAPFYRQMADWSAKMDPTLKGAELEKQENINLRQLLHNQAMEKWQNRRVDVSEDAEERRERTRLDNIQKENRKAAISELKANDANWEVKSEKGTGRVYMIHPRLGKRDMGLHVDDVTEEQKHRWEMDKIRERGAVTEANKGQEIHYFDAYENGVPVHKMRNEKTGEVVNVGEAFTIPDPPGPTRPPTAQPPATQPPQAPTQGGAPATGSQFGSLSGVSFGAPKPQPQAPLTQTAKPSGPYQGRPPSEADQQKGLETQVARARQKYPDESEYITWNDETQLPEITKPTRDWMGFGSGWTPYTWEKYDEINKFIFGPDFKRESGPVTGGTTSGNTRTTSRGTTVTRID